MNQHPLNKDGKVMKNLIMNYNNWILFSIYFFFLIENIFLYIGEFIR